AELRTRGWQTERRAIANELDETLCGQHADPFADRVLAAEPGLVLEALGELQRGVEPAGLGLIEEQLKDHVVFACALGVELLAELATHEPCLRAIDHDPASVRLVDDHRLDAAAVAALEMQHPLRSVLARPVHDHAGGVEAAEATRARDRRERAIDELLVR